MSFQQPVPAYLHYAQCKQEGISLGEPVVPILVPSLSQVRPLNDETLPNLVNENASIEEGERMEWRGWMSNQETTPKKVNA